MTSQAQNAVVWAEIPVTDLDAGVAFYSKVFNVEMSIVDGGPNMIANFGDPMQPGVSGHLYPGTPSEHGPTIHLAVPDTLEDSMARCQEAGGKVVSEPIPLPVGRFAYAQDPDGNSIGLFEAKVA
ncbi:VOC family protein [Pontivivens insulae]|uniref:VOC domain-containing protein n=1 Tax=Pontivivens insulae TaxID=1639689 RepID=A0A2R8AEY7_9RHOB|nr:VOC family protein [Pontivivens insulae]RED11868.1 hypothetical protein DFR53_2579 [Pontivivens insulae]SPF30625.1 hypothetical protein POI8812_02965 [Pontivivens insulae]